MEDGMRSIYAHVLPRARANAVVQPGHPLTWSGAAIPKQSSRRS